MRRRRQKNPLLFKIIGISVGAHIVALPILAHYGAFKKIQEHFVEARIVVLPPPDRPKLPQEKVKAPPKKAPVVARRSHSSQHSQGAKPNPNQVHIALAKGPGAGEGEPGAQQGTLEAGALPPDTTKQASTNTTPTAPATTTKQTNTAPVAATAPTITKTDAPVIKQAAPVVAAPAPHVPVFTEATPIDGHQPQPTIPDELRSDALDTTVVLDVTVGADGAPTVATIAQSTGKRELDRLATEAARQWRFTPATRDGEPVESHVRLHIEFQVN